MLTNKLHPILAFILIMVICASLVNVQSVRADGETPTEPPAPTEVATEPPAAPAPTQAATEPPTEAPVASTPEPAEPTAQPVEATSTPIAEILTQVPEGTQVVVTDENGSPIPLATQEAAQITTVVDPIWCPEGTLPGAVGCSASYSTISALINNMVSNTAFYTQNGVIYFTTDPGTGTFNLSPTTLTSDFDTLKSYNLTVQGGWNGSTASPSFSGQTDFGSRPITIGSSTNPWVGNVTLNDIVFCGNVAVACSAINQTALTIHTTTGDITLSNVDVNNQAGGKNTALLETTSGDIHVSNGTFDGNNSNSAGLSATSGGGTITISDSAFTENKRPTPPNTFDGATLSAPVVNLSNVTATGNDGNGITINNADTATLVNVLANGNGTDITPTGFTNNIGSGVFFNGNPGSKLILIGGQFNNNQRYGVELANPANTTIYIPSAPTCTGNDSNAAPINSCSNGALVPDTTPPTLALPTDIVAPASGPTGAVVTYSATATDDVDPIVSVSCVPASGSLFPVGSTTVDCSSTDTAGNTAAGSFKVTIVDTTVTVTPGTGTVPGTSGGSSSSSSLFGIPLTGGEVIHLDCESSFWQFGIKLSFFNLCDYRTTLSSMSLNNLPGPLPDGLSFILGLNLNILGENEALENLPSGASVQIGFPIPAGSQDQFAVLYWNGNDWIEVSRQVNDDQGFYDVKTTNELGVFILVKK
jgi:hypothetical protein